MIILEILGKIFVQILFEGIIHGFFRLIGKGFNKLNNLFSRTETPIDPIKALEKKYLYKNIELTEYLNEELISGRNGTVMEIIISQDSNSIRQALVN